MVNSVSWESKKDSLRVWLNLDNGWVLKRVLDLLSLIEHYRVDCLSTRTRRLYGHCQIVRLCAPDRRHQQNPNRACLRKCPSNCTRIAHFSEISVSGLSAWEHDRRRATNFPRRIPQGSILSPLIFDVVMASLPDALKVGFKLPVYAVIHIRISGYQQKRLARITVGVTSIAECHLSTLGLSFPAEKICLHTFTGSQVEVTQFVAQPAFDSEARHQQQGITATCWWTYWGCIISVLGRRTPFYGRRSSFVFMLGCLLLKDSVKCFATAHYLVRI